MHAQSGRGLAVVTGASSGIGEAIAVELSRRGWPVLAVARRAGRLEELARHAAQAKAAPIHPLCADLTGPEAAGRVAERARQHGRIDWLVNNAGVAIFGPFATSDVDQQVAQLRLNCEATLRLTRALLPELVRQGRGAIVNVSSMAGFQPSPLYSAYGASKAFITSFSEGLREELRGTGVTVTAVCPGPVSTEIFDRVASAGGRRRLPHEISAAQAARLALRAAERDAAVAVPGWINLAVVLATSALPRFARRWLGRLLAVRYLGLSPHALGGAEAAHR